MKTASTPVLLAIASLLFLHPANAQPKYMAIAIAKGEGNGINSEGDVVGTLNLTNPMGDSFLYKKGKLTLIAAFPEDKSQNDAIAHAVAVNDSDEVVGLAGEGFEGGDPGLDAFLYQNGKMKIIAYGSGDPSTHAAISNGINNQGEVVGTYDTSTTSSFRIRGFVYRNGRLLTLGTLGGSGTSANAGSSANAVNNLNQIVGTAENVNGNYEAFLYQNGRMQAIGGAQSANFTPRSINDHGQITGVIGLSNIASRAVLYQGGQLRDLGTLPGTIFSDGLSINNSGEIIGICGTAGTAEVPSVTTPFLYTGGKMYDLNKILILAPGWRVTDVGQINDAGQVAATGTFKGQTTTYALLLTRVNLSHLP